MKRIVRHLERASTQPSTAILAGLEGGSSASSAAALEGAGAH
jgi:hypothetical protein